MIVPYHSTLHEIFSDFHLREYSDTIQLKNFGHSTLPLSSESGTFSPFMVV